ncbi:hypothetical protein [Maricaulis sp.]|uniref:hypothetical protein n=1 Tax=Maricaulis sp. TaxID=1486257 RepID=UPI003A921974
MLHVSQAGFDYEPVCFYPEITDSLRIVAGENALELACLFPSPSSVFLNQPRQVMHLTGLALAVGDTQIDNHFLNQKWSVQLKETLPNQWHGCRKIFSKIPLPMLTVDQYKKLFDLLNCPAAKKFLQHDNNITGNTIEILHELPVELRVPGVVKFIDHTKEARIIAMLCADSEAASCFLDKVRDIPSRGEFWTDATTYLIARAFEFPIGPKIDHPSIHQIVKPTDLVSFARKFRNCLKGCVGDGITGSTAYYHYAHPTEPAVIALKSRFGGNSAAIEEMKGVGNARLSDETRRIIATAFAQHGIIDASDNMFGGCYDGLYHAFFSIGRSQLDADAIDGEADTAINLIQTMFQPSAGEGA